MAKKNLSNPFSTGGGGAHFEAHVQASFVALMLTGGYAPCLPCWPIAEIKLQGKIDGFNTDDFIVVVEKSETKERRKLLGQVKHTISITKGGTLFGEVIQAAWNDYNNPDVFVKGNDIIALITGPLSATDEHNVQWLLSQARHTKSADEFFRNVQQANFSPPKSGEKLEVIQHHLKKANGGTELSKEELYTFLKHFHLLGYDLGEEIGVVLSLLHSHISQFQQQVPEWVWSRVVDIVQTWNQNSGTITLKMLPEDLVDTFRQKTEVQIPDEFKTGQEIVKTDWTHHKDATYLALTNLIGGWNDKSKGDVEILTQLIGITYDEWIQKAREVLHLSDSPLSLKNGYWKVINRLELWNILGSRVLDQNLESFKILAISVLKETDPSFELPVEKRVNADIRNKRLKYSQELRKGIADGLAMLGCYHQVFNNCSQGKAEVTTVLVIREIFNNADWVLWGSLNNLLPSLAEAAPLEFLNAVEGTLSMTPCPFDQLFLQEGQGITGSNYLTGLLWALEDLAWEVTYFVRVCVVLGDLASHDPGGGWTNRPFNSLATILLPWLPQTLASIEKRKVAVKILNKELPDIGWRLIIQLLPGQHQSSLGSYKPVWRKTIPDTWGKRVTNLEYRQQVSFYAELAVYSAGLDIFKLSELIDHLNNLPNPAFDQLIDILSSRAIAELPEEQQTLIWDQLSKFTSKQRRFADAKWALSDAVVTRIEDVASKLAPTNPFNLYQSLFSDIDFDLYEKDGNWEEKQRRLNLRRETAIAEIFQRGGIENIVRFAETVTAPNNVGYSLGTIEDQVIEQAILPSLLDSEDKKHLALVSGLIWRKHQINSWDWCDNIDKSKWSTKQIGQLLAWLPFTREAWERAAQWLGEYQTEYWVRTNANAYQAKGDLDMAIDKLIENGRPYAAIDCLGIMRYSKQPINPDQCVRVLLAALSSKEPTNSMDRNQHHIVELIKFLQSDPMVSKEGLFKIEWAYLPILDRYSGAAPKLLESRLASDPEFFCEVIRLIYRSKKENKPQKDLSEKSNAIATNAYRLLREWKIPPGVQEDGSFNVEHFNGWLKLVKAICTETGHLEVALIKIGEVLVHSPSDPGGLWIHRTIAEALNSHDVEDMRSGYSTGLFNSRGVHWVDPTGMPEKELAAQFRSKAEEVENGGFQRLATTLRVLADGYERDAERIVSEYKNRDEH
jgi:hypothetical protein